MKSERILASLTTFVGLTALAASAAAQPVITGSASAEGSATVTAPPPPPPPATTGGAVVEAQVAAPAPVVVAQPAPPPPPPPAGYAVAPEEDSGRFRVGFDIGGGYALAALNGLTVSGGAFNLGLRLGWQINNALAVYYQGNLPIAVVGSASSSSSSTSVSGGAIVEQTNAVMGEFTLGNLLELGLGPSVDFVAAGLATSTASSGGGSASATALSGTAFGLNGRVALILGRVRPGRRMGFGINGNLHSTFTGSGTVLLATIGLGAEWH